MGLWAFLGTHCKQKSRAFCFKTSDLWAIKHNAPDFEPLKQKRSGLMLSGALGWQGTARVGSKNHKSRAFVPAGLKVRGVIVQRSISPERPGRLCLKGSKSGALSFKDP